MFSANDRKDKQRKRLFRMRFPSGSDGVAQLSTWLAEGKQVDFELKPHEAKIILVLYQSYQEDLGVWTAGLRGWRSRARIAKEIAERTGYEVGEAAISSYTVKLLRKLSDAVNAASAGEKVSLVERRRKLGFRLAEGVEIQIVDGTRRGPADCA